MYNVISFRFRELRRKNRMVYMHTRTLRHHAFITIIIIVIFIDKIFIPLILSYPIHIKTIDKILK